MYSIKLTFDYTLQFQSKQNMTKMNGWKTESKHLGPEDSIDMSDNHDIINLTYINL